MMKKLLFLITLLSINFCAFAQEEIVEVPEEKVELNEDVIFVVVERPPAFSGCENVANEEVMACTQMAVTRFIQKNVRYPDEARDKGLQDKVYVKFVVNKEGKVESAEVMRGNYEVLNVEALRVINTLPKMEPGTQRGKPVKVSMIVPINFKLG